MYSQTRTPTVTSFALLNESIALLLQEKGINASAPIRSVSNLAQNIDQRLAADIKAVMQNICSEIKSDSIKISVLPVRYHVTSQVQGIVDGCRVFLAGDAAMGLPLEKGLNYG